MELTDARKLNRDAQEALRKRVIQAVEHEKMKQIDAVQIFKVSRPAINKWLKKYRQEGEKALNKKNKGDRNLPEN